MELVHGLDPRLDRTAEEALAKWQFTPAMRNGEPVDVDILVEIPFRLKPRLEWIMKKRTTQHLIFDADDTLWENNIYFEDAFDRFCEFLNHSR